LTSWWFSSSRPACSHQGERDRRACAPASWAAPVQPAQERRAPAHHALDLPLPQQRPAPLRPTAPPHDALRPALQRPMARRAPAPDRQRHGGAQVAPSRRCSGRWWSACSRWTLTCSVRRSKASFLLATALLSGISDVDTTIVSRNLKPNDHSDNVVQSMNCLYHK
jgi:hypothetical protein